MDEVFKLVQPANNVLNPGQVTNTEINLFDNFATVTRDQVLASNVHYRTYGQNDAVENLSWSELLLFNSCDSDLRNKVKENLASLDDDFHGGPLFFFEMISIILDMTADETENLKESIKTMTMQDFLGEDVEKSITLLRSCIKRLDLINQVLLNVNDQLIRIFQTSSVPAFNKSFEVMSTFEGLSITINPESIFHTASKQYKRLMKEWNVPDNAKTSTFNTTSELTCWGCGERGHRIDECPKTTAKQRTKIVKARSAGGGGRGRGGGGNNRDRNRRRNGGGGNKGQWAPPKDNEKHTKKINEKEYKWCKTCSRWTNHLTSEHIKGYKKDTNGNGGGATNFMSQIGSQM
jgi:hypothetical protein